MKCEDGYETEAFVCLKLKNKDCLQHDGRASDCKVCKNSFDDLPVLSYFDYQC